MKTATLSTLLLLLPALGFRELAAGPLRIAREAGGAKISVYRPGHPAAVLIQNARRDFRPYIHPLVAPDGNGVLTEYSPSHHRHQTGLYWGFTRVNGRDYFHHPEGTHWRRVAARVLEGRERPSDRVRWQTVYELLDEDGAAVMLETQSWSVREEERGGRAELVLELEWRAEARRDLTVSKDDVGGLFLRAPWKEGMKAEVVNSVRQRGAARADGQRALWLDLGLQVEGRQDLAHVSILDHSKNRGFPEPWRVDRQSGVGPAPARLGDWKIPEGKSEVLRYQLRVSTGELDEDALTEQWMRYTGQRGTSVQWHLAQEEGRRARFLTPREAVAAMTLPAGFVANVYASEPMITQPMAFCWDDRGRMWIAENRDYESRGRGFAGDGGSRILILEDTDHDGAADSRKVFLEGIPFPSGIAVGFDGLWLGAPPNLLFVPDRDGDDRADTAGIEVRLTGWGLRDRHEVMNSFRWGPDGWLYGCEGFATSSRVGKPRGKGKLYRKGDAFPRKLELDGPGTEINGGVWRYHPQKRRFEVVAHGFSNPWGVDFDAKGEIFITACVIPHLFHVIQGGIYHRQGGRHFNPYVYRDIRTIADHRHRSAHGGARIYLSDAFPERYRGRIFMCNVHEHAVLTDILEPRGSGFVAHHGDDFLLANNAQWIGFSVEIGPGGGVYALDWHDGDICGTSVLQKQTGRVYRVMPVVSRAREWPGRYDDLASKSDRELAALQRSPSDWHARRARLLLQNRARKGAVAAAALDDLRAMLRDAGPDHRLRALWALWVSRALSAADLMALLDDGDAHLRAWAVRLLGEDRDVPPAAREKLVLLAREDPSAVVRLHLSSALQRLEREARWPLARALVTRAEDAGDHNIPRMIWFGIEPLVAAAPERSVELALASRLPLVTRHVARRLADANRYEAVVRSLASASGPVRLELLLGLREGFEGRKDLKRPAGWASIYPELLADGNPEVGRVALDVARQLGDRSAARTLLGRLEDPGAKPEERLQALRALARQGFDALRPRLPALLGDGLLRREAIRATASFDDEDLARTLLARYDRFDRDEKLEAVMALASRSASGRRLAEAIRFGRVPRRDVPPYVARQLRRTVGAGFTDIWGPIDVLAGDKQAQLSRYRALLGPEALARADPRAGRAVFERTCASCHTLYGQGGLIGPELTGANRGDLEYLLGNILNPSEVIQDAYRMRSVLTQDGRLYSGILAGENERQIELRVVGEREPVVIARADILSDETDAVSMMPEGLLATLSDQEVLQLVAYLRTTKQVELPPRGKRTAGSDRAGPSKVPSR